MREEKERKRENEKKETMRKGEEEIHRQREREKGEGGTQRGSDIRLTRERDTKKPRRDNETPKVGKNTVHRIEEDQP